jgi:hypothetical protein
LVEADVLHRIPSRRELADDTTGFSSGWAVSGYSLSLDTTGPIENNGKVQITVAVVRPNSTHWIAAYSPAGANIRY